MTKPNKKGFFGKFGGAYVPDTLMPALIELYDFFESVYKDKSFNDELNYYLKNYVGRPTPLYFAQNLSNLYKLQVYLKREDLNHTGAHKINNTLGQILMAKRMKKNRVIAETGAGQHGVATATVCALMNIKCEIYMGAEDIKRQALNVDRMRLLGAKVNSVNSGSKTLKDATTEAIRDWMKNVKNTHYIIGSALGPHPYPYMVRCFQSVIGKEAKAQIKKEKNQLPHHVVACIGGGSNAMGIFHPFVKDKEVNLVGVEAAGEGVDTELHAASLTKGRPGVLHGSLNYVLQDKVGQIKLAHSISAGLDYPGVGPELSYLKDSNRLTTFAVTNSAAINACKELSKKEGIIPALETAHAFALLNQKNPFKENEIVVMCLSGRGDKDMETISNYV
jgi:tryptophan synthase beta chain